jgi:hypothetical protein
VLIRARATTANRYSHALIDPRELDWPEMLARARKVQAQRSATL